MTLPLWNPFASERHILLSDVSSEECIKRLRQQFHNPWTSVIPNYSLAYGSVRGKRFLLLRNVISPRGLRRHNAFATVARGSITPAAYGAKINVTLSLNPFLLPFIIGWPLALIVITLLPLIVHFQHTPGLGVWLIGTGFLMIFYINLYTIGRKWSRDDGAFLLAFLRHILIAQEASDTPHV